MNARRPTLALLVSITLLAGCGGGDDGEDLIAEEDLRDCVAEAGFTVETAGVAASPGLGSITPDFRATGDGRVVVDLAVFGTTRKAERAAADVRSALAGFGAADAEVVHARNAVAIFDRAPSGDQAAAVEDCLGG